MKDSLQRVHLTDKDHLIAALMATNYAFAIWRMPLANQNNFIISLKEPAAIDDGLFDATPGFVINRYDDNHPAKPIHISADLVIEEDDMKIDPCVSDVQLDQLNEDLNRVSRNDTPPASAPKINENYDRAFEQLVQKAVDEINEGRFEKVVLSRFHDERLPRNFSPWEFYQRIESKYKGAFCSMTFIPGKGLWIGASPELLASGNEQGFKTVSLAGTKKLESGQDLTEIAWTQKEIEEQALVSRYIINCFKKLRLREFHENGPKTVKAGNLAHLKTTFEVKFDEVLFEGLTDQMIELLHPTSAVCGMPIEMAKPWIVEYENYDREFYAGFLGPVNYQNSTELFVNLRCARINNSIIRFFAGAGITQDSIPKKEFEETEMKIDVLRNILKQS